MFSFYDGCCLVRRRFALPQGSRFSVAASPDSIFSALPWIRHIGNLAMRRLENPAEGLAGNVHCARCFFLIEPLVIRQADRLEFVERQEDFVEVEGGMPRGLK